MISVGSRDVSKALELRFDREHMEETELEEGEAFCNVPNDDENNSSTIDPDIALSYIDEKLQDVLGHLQKDFEGGVSADSLGAKYGAYGSFLPTYQRSPSWSCLRTPPDNGQLQNGLTNSVYLSPEMISSSSVTGVRPTSRNGKGNQGVNLLPNHGKGLNSKPDLPKSTNLSDQKSLKVRIKVGKVNLSFQKNAEIYSGLGLDVSPSSSLNESPIEGLHHELQDITDESLTRIIQIMTSDTIFGSLLSPLSDEVIHLTKKENADTTNQGSASKVANRSDLTITDRKMSHGNKPNIIKQSSVSVSPTRSNTKQISHATSVVLKKETKMDTLACEELISSTLKLPLLSDADVADTEKDSVKSKVDKKASVEDRVKNASSCDTMEKEPLESVASLENGWASKPAKESSVSGKAAESRKANCFNENLAYHKKEVSYTNEKYELAMKNEVHVCEDEISSHDEDSSKLFPGKRHLSSACKKRSYESQGIVAQEVKSPEDGMLSKSSLLHRSKMSSNRSSNTSKSDTEDLTKGHVKAVDKYKECSGDLEVERDNDSIESEKMSSLQMGNGSELVEKRSIDKSNTILKEKASGKKNEELSALGCGVLAPNVTHLAGEVYNPRASPSAAAPLLNEDWVRCDKCQTWRLLPLGTHAKSLPEKWVCGMLDWLHGMNHCSISQDDTTHALRAAQASATSEGKHKLHPLSSMNLPGVSPGDARRSTDDYQCPGFQETGALQKGHASKDVENQTQQESISLVPNSKKRLQEHTKARSMNDIDKSPAINDFGYHHAPRSSVSSEDRCEEESKNMPGNKYSLEADLSKSKIKKKKKKKDNDVDSMNASKKMKVGDFHLKDENCTSDLGGVSLRAGPSSIHGLSNGALGKDRHDSNHNSNLNGRMTKLSGLPERPDIANSIRPDIANSISSDDGSQILAVHSPKDYMKRKVSDPHSLESRSLLKECHETGERREKKARFSKSEGNGCNTDNPGTAEKVSRVTKYILGHNQVSTASQFSTDDADPLRRDLGSLQPLVAATSSTSKVSSSHKSKASLQEMKDSPVESVSSSPLRTTNVSKFSHTSRDAPAKDAFRDADFSVRGSPRISVDDEHVLDTCQTGKTRSVDGMDLLQNVKNKEETSHFTAQQVTNGNASSPDKGGQNACQIETLKKIQNVRERNASSHAGHSKKAGKGLSSRSKEKEQVSRSLCDNSKVKHFEQEENPSYKEKRKAGISKSQGKFGISCDGIDKNHVSRRDSVGNLDHKDCKEDIPSKFGVHDDTAARDVISCQDMKQTETGRLSRSLHSGKTVIEGSERGKSNLIQASLIDQREATKDLSSMVELKKESGECASNKDDQSRASKQSKRPEKLNGNQQMTTRNSNSSTCKGRPAGENLVQKDSPSQAITDALKEAKNLKHMADRVKSTGSTESTGLYFQAALKFLHGASLLETCSSENTKPTEIQSMQIYSSTAKLCEFCAHEYEKSRDMAAAALAYKCAEVAYLRVIYSSHAGTSKYQDEVQTALQLIPTGDSPSSSASDIDNLNNAAIVDKAIASKGVCSPQVAGSHVLTAHYRTSCLRLVQFAQDVTFAMEASRKSRIRLGEAQNKEGISTVKRALDFNYQNMDGLLRAVRVAMEAINR